MSRKQQAIDMIVQQAMLPLYFHESEEVSVQVLISLYNAGIRAVEYTNRGKEALQNFKRMRCERDLHFKDLQLGIGTIKNAADAAAFIEAGADFIISPGLVPDVVSIADKERVLLIPGCMTVSELIVAEGSGAKLVKLFPGNMLGPGYVSTIKDIFPNLLFMPTGGVELTEENISAWFKAGVAAVGMGSKLLRKDLLEQQNYQAIQETTKEALRIVQSVKHTLL